MSNYEDYAAKKNEYWKARFVWNGLHGNCPTSTLSITNYFKAGRDVANEFLDFRKNQVNKVTDLFKKIEELSIDYVAFCKENYSAAFNDAELKNLKEFFKGTLGEYFMMTFLEETRTVLTMGNKLYKFSNICLPPMDYRDDGVDALCTITNLSHPEDSHNAAIQFKFWKPFGKQTLTIDIAQKLYAEATSEDFVNKTDNDILVFVWTGNESDISVEFKKSKFYQQSVFVDMSSFKNHVNEKDTDFWYEVFPKRLEAIKNF